MPKSKLKVEIAEKENNKNIPLQENQIFKGRVVSVKTAKTATVLIERRKTHPLYKKSYAQSKKFLVHDDLGVKPGDVVEIIKCKPMSKNKHFRIVKVVGRDIEAIVTEQLKKEAKAAIEEVIPEQPEGENISESESQQISDSEKTKKSEDKQKEKTKTKKEKE
jgi:small subunit ribosomal protein S17